jgi:hypothetical protein
MTTYALGAVTRLSTTVADASGVLTNPAAISLTILLPDGTTSGPHAPVNDSTGIYHHDYVTAHAGRHVARWATTTPTGASEESFDVAALWSEAGIVSLDDAKAQLNIDTATTDDDEELRGFIRSVTAVCERFVGALGRTTYVETQPGGYTMALNHAPVLSVTSMVAVETSGTDQVVADLAVDATAGIVQRLDGARIRGPVRVTYVAGRGEVPPHVRQAALIILQHMWETQRGGIPARFGGQDDVFDARFTFTIPRRAQELLGVQLPGIA